MTTLRDIRRQIQSVENVKQITKTMEMVAAARLHRAQVKAEQSHRYALKIQQILDNLAAGATDFNHPFFALRPIKKTGIVIVSADKGLCGSYNASVFARTEKFLSRYKPENAELILIGRKACEHFQHKNWKIRHRIREWSGKLAFQEVKNLSNVLVQLFLSGELDEIWLIYTHFVSVMSYQVVEEKFLGLGKPKTEKKILNFIYEPSAYEIYAELLPRYCLSKIQSTLNESYASELAARLFSMRKATKNAEELMVKLTLLCNKIRQSNITREMIEISSGAEGIK